MKKTIILTIGIVAVLIGFGYSAHRAYHLGKQNASLVSQFQNYDAQSRASFQFIGQVFSTYFCSEYKEYDGIAIKIKLASSTEEMRLNCSGVVRGNYKVVKNPEVLGYGLYFIE